jgi:L-aspartate oxidase
VLASPGSIDRGGVRMSLPLRLAGPAVTWDREVDVVIVGSGAAGLACALAARATRSVLVVTKDTLDAGSTAWAQGGLAGVLDPNDSLESHVHDTLVAGAGLCDEQAVRTLVAGAPGAIHHLIELGATFDPGSGGGIALTREGGHSRNRIVHAGGDQSGAEVQRTLDEAAVAAGAEVLDRALALDLLMGTRGDGARQVCGIRVGRLDAHGTVVSVGLIWARAVVLATGGYGQIFASTSNPPAVTGDGLAMALRAGLQARDLEFIQFHPSVLWVGADSTGQQALISEAVRGEGAVLLDGLGRRIMKGVHPQEDLAPRDVVAAAITRRMAEAPGGIGDHVFLDATRLGERFYERFPSITAACRKIGIDPATEPIPIAPAAHYVSGGIVATIDGVTDAYGLYAVGEVACTGVHGANRLASNSVTEGLVAGSRAGTALAAELPTAANRPDDRNGEVTGSVNGPLVNPALRIEVRSAMSRNVGVLRSPKGLASVGSELAALSDEASTEVTGSRPAWEATNMLTIARAVVAAARARTESRGCHRRTDFTEQRDVWLTHLSVMLDRDGAPVVTGTPVAE